MRRIAPIKVSEETPGDPPLLSGGGWDCEGCAEAIRRRTEPGAPSMLHVSEEDFASARTRARAPWQDGGGTGRSGGTKRKPSGYEMSGLCEEVSAWVKVTRCIIVFPEGNREVPVCKNCRAYYERNERLVKKPRGRPKGRSTPIPACFRCKAEQPPIKLRRKRPKNGGSATEAVVDRAESRVENRRNTPPGEGTRRKTVDRVVT